MDANGLAAAESLAKRSNTTLKRSTVRGELGCAYGVHERGLEVTDGLLEEARHLNVGFRVERRAFRQLLPTDERRAKLVGARVRSCLLA